MGDGEASSGGQPLSPAARLFHAPRINCYIIAIMGCKTKINPDVVKAGLEQTLLKHPRFSSKLVISKPYPPLYYSFLLCRGSFSYFSLPSAHPSLSFFFIGLFKNVLQKLLNFSFWKRDKESPDIK
jgi:hypothetical protein